MQTINLEQLVTVTGGVSRTDFNAIRDQAKDYCPQTAQRFARVNPATITRPQAEKMGNQCLAEMGSFKALFARPVIEDAINSTFPRR